MSTGIKKQLNCPNCGAPITGIKCEYCGTQFLDFAVIDMERPFYIRVVKQGNSLMTCKVKVEEFNIRTEQDIPDVLLYENGKPFYCPLSKSKNKLETVLHLINILP